MSLNPRSMKAIKYLTTLYFGHGAATLIEARPPLRFLTPKNLRGKHKCLRNMLVLIEPTHRFVFLVHYLHIKL